jgi:polysaccharide export outer membrane protein
MHVKRYPSVVGLLTQRTWVVVALSALLVSGLAVVSLLADHRQAAAVDGSSTESITKSITESTSAEPRWLEIDARQQGNERAAFEAPAEASSLAIQLCQAYGPAPCDACGDACQRRIDGVDCRFGDGCGEPRWNTWGPIPWQAFAQGEYIGPARLAHVPEYRLRVDDEVEFVYVLMQRESSKPYPLQVGDVVRIESLVDPTINRDVPVQPDGTITVLLLGEVHAGRLTTVELQRILNERYLKFYKKPDILVSPIKTNTRLEQLKAAVDNRFFSGGQGRRVRVNPEGTVSLPGIDQVPAQGLTLEEVKREVNERYAQIVDGLEVTPNLAQRAPRYVFVLGEVRTPGRYELQGPTTAMDALALAGGWNNGGNTRQIVVFRRAEDWRLLATKLDLSGALSGHRPAPADEIWIRDSDLVVVPKTALKQTDDVIELVFTQGIYRVFPINFNYTWGSGSTITQGSN